MQASRVTIRDIVKHITAADPLTAELASSEFRARFDEVARTDFGVLRPEAEWQTSSVERVRRDLGARATSKVPQTISPSKIGLGATLAGIVLSLVFVFVDRLSGRPSLCYGLILDAALTAILLYKIAYYRFTTDRIAWQSRRALVSTLVILSLPLVTGVMWVVAVRPAVPSSDRYATRAVDGTKPANAPASGPTGSLGDQAVGRDVASDTTHSTDHDRALRVIYVPYSLGANPSRVSVASPGSATDPGLGPTGEQGKESRRQLLIQPSSANGDYEQIFPDTNPHSVSVSAEASPPLASGSSAIVVGTDSGDSVKSAPRMSAKTVGYVRDGVAIQILEGPVYADGHWWYRHDHGGWSMYSDSGYVMMAKIESKPPLGPGDSAVTQNTDHMLRVRTAPNGPDTGRRLADGEPLRIEEGPIYKGAGWWYRHDHGGWSMYSANGYVMMRHRSIASSDVRQPLDSPRLSAAVDCRPLLLYFVASRHTSRSHQSELWMEPQLATGVGYCRTG